MDHDTLPATDAPEEVALCLELGRAYQAFGVPAHRFEEALGLLAVRRGSTS